MTERIENDDRFVEQLAALHERMVDDSAQPLDSDQPLAPELAEALNSAEQMFAMIERVQRAQTQDTHPQELTLRGDGGPHDLVPGIDLAETVGQRIGRFEIRRELGRGGYGIVFLAHDTELDREVALKIPRPEAILTDEMQARFLREGKAAALLAHPNIVPVFETGRLGRVCFIVSAYVPGQTLGEWLANLGTPCESHDAARLLVALADAVQHAHSKGVIHRDLKPANVLIESDPQGTLESVPAAAACKIADFGLAKTVSDQQSLTGTGTGAVVGTPAYMSPEQARGKNSEVAETTDVYSLGAILYELITKSPPFHGDSVIEVLRSVHENEPIPISRLNPHIDRDLEAICDKCLEKDPARRYDSAAALSADLNCYLNHEPVSARPVTTLQRFGKWSRRNPLVAGLSLAAAVSVCAALMAASVGWWTTATANAAANRRYHQAKAAVNEYFTRVSEDKLLTAPGLKPLRQDLLGAALAYYEQLLLEQGDDPQLAQEIEDTHFRMATIHFELGNTERALQEFQETLTLLENRTGSNGGPTRAEDLARKGRALHKIGTLHLMLGRPVDAENSINAALESLETAAASNSMDLTLQQDLASSHHQKGFIYRAIGKPADAVTEFEASLRLRKSIADAAPGEAEYQSNHAKAQGDLANLMRSLGRVDVAKGLTEESTATFRCLVEKHPSNLAYQQALAIGLSNHSTYHVMAGNPQTGVPLVEEAREIFRRLSLLHPQVAEYQTGHAFAVDRLGLLISMSGDAENAIAPMRDAQQLFRQLIEKQPDVIDMQSSLAGNHLNLGSMLAGMDNYAEANLEFSSALACYEAIREKLPDNIEARQGCAFALVNLGIASDELQDTEQALAQISTAIEQLAAIHKEHPRHPLVRRELARAASYRASVLDRQLRSSEALDDRKLAVSKAFPPDMAGYQLQLATTLARCGQHEQAIDLIEQHAEAGEQAPETRSTLAIAYAAAARSQASADTETTFGNALLQKCQSHLSSVTESGYFEAPRHLRWLQQQPEFAWLGEQNVALP